MTPRPVKEWIGRTPDSAIPDRVKERVREKAGNKCQSCCREFAWGEKGEYDHKESLKAKGENREGNLQLLCVPCHRHKTHNDAGIHAYERKKRRALYGIKPRKSRPMPGSKDSDWKITFSRGAVRR